MKKQKFYHYSYHNYEIKYYIFKNQEYSNIFKLEILEKIIELNQKTLNLKYGIFDPKLTKEQIIKELIDNMMISMIYLEDELVGYQCFFIMEIPSTNKHCIHYGLTFIHKNKGVNLLTTMGLTCGLILQKHYPNFYISSITTIPKILEIFDFLYSDFWPSPARSLRKPPKEYKAIVCVLFNKYIKKVFPASNLIDINYKRFTLILEKREAGFDEYFFKLPRAEKFIYNLFCQNWIDYNNNEDLILIGRFKLKSKILFPLMLIFQELKGDFKKIVH